jgi:hypothetical protein
MVPEIEVLPGLVATNEGTPPAPLPARPILVLLLVQVKVAPAGVLVKLAAATVAPEHTEVLAGTTADGLGLTVTVNVEGVPAQPATVGVTVMVEVMLVAPLLVVVNPGTLPVPLPAKPVLVLLLVQV